LRKHKERERQLLRQQYLARQADEKAKQQDEKLLQFVEERAPGGLRGSAFHEASHAVTSELLHFPIEYISIIPNANRPRLDVDGQVGISIGCCQLVRNEEGVVVLDSYFKSFCYYTQKMESFPAEKRLGIFTKESVVRDIEKLGSNTHHVQSLESMGGDFGSGRDTVSSPSDKR